MHSRGVKQRLRRRERSGYTVPGWPGPSLAGPDGLGDP
jgi:hypothetical protein